MHFVVGALSISGELQKIGAIAGLAAIPGLAILALLYFSQAREVRRLREWAGRAPERAQEMQDRVSAQAGRPAAATQPPRRVAPQPPRAPGGSVQSPPRQPAPAPAAARAAAPGSATGAG